jgi:endoglucanase
LNDISWELIVKPYSETIINAIRKIDPNNLIIVGTPSWSQDVDLAADNPILDQHNLLYALHFYAASHKNELREKAEYAISKGLPLIISEWGTVSSDGDGFMDEESTLEWIRFIRKNNLTHLNWAVSDKNEAASILTKGANSSGPWRPQDLTSSGKFVQKIIREW